MELSNDQIRRYSRQIILPEVGQTGQRKIRDAKVLCIGAGGLGSPAALYLAAAGVGTLGIVDFDVVEISNLQRQILHPTWAVGTPKTASAEKTLREINPEVNVVTHRIRLASSNALELIRPYDIVLDGTDNFPARYLANDACVFLGKPNVYGSIFRFEGQASLFAPHLGGPCYRCLYPEPPPPGTVPSCAEGGVLGVLPGLIGTIQATETLKLILGQGTSLLNRLLLVNALEMRFQEVKVRRDPGCAVCGKSPTIKALVDYEPVCGAMRTDDSSTGEVTVHEMKKVIDDSRSSIKVLDVREPHEYEIAHVPGTVLLPLSQLRQRFTELDPNCEYYIHCKAGVRSRQAQQFLQEHGFKHLKNVRGGILAWSREIDPTVPEY